MAKTPYAVFEKYSKHIFLGSVFLLLAVLFIGVAYNGAKGWINIPFLPFSTAAGRVCKVGNGAVFCCVSKEKKSTNF